MGAERRVWSPPPGSERPQEGSEARVSSERRWADNRWPWGKGISDGGITLYLKQKGKVSQ